MRKEVKSYSNDDMEVTLIDYGTEFGVFPFSYDGTLNLAYIFTDYKAAQKFYKFVFDNFKSSCSPVLLKQARKMARSLEEK